MTLRAGVIGCGRIGSEFDVDPTRLSISSHAGAYYKLLETNLVSLCDIDSRKLERCGRRWGVSALYQDVEEMLTNEALDIVSICTPSSTHLQMVQETAKYGVRAIFCEKPMANFTGECAEMIQLCRDRDILLQVDHQRRFDPTHQEIRKFLQTGGLGKIQQATFYYTAGINNTGSHMFDLLRFFFGDASWVMAVLGQGPSRSPLSKDPNYNGVIQFQSGLFCSIQACDDQSFRIFELNCLGTEGRMNLTHNGWELEFFGVAPSHLFQGYKALYPGPSPIKTDRPREFLLDGVRHLVDCLNTGRRSLCSGEDGQASVALVQAFSLSASRGGERLTLPIPVTP
jgi:predicted dehydrogenase